MEVARRKRDETILNGSEKMDVPDGISPQNNPNRK